MLILHQNSQSYQSINYLFLQTFKTHFPYKNKYASHNLNHVEQRPVTVFKKKNETSSLTIANNLKLQIKRQQMDYGLRVVIFSTRPGLRLRLAAVKIADTLGCCGSAFPNSPLFFRSICCRIVLSGSSISPYDLLFL